MAKERKLPPDDQRCVHAATQSPDGRCRNYRQFQSTECRTHSAAPQKQNAIQKRQAAHAAKSRAMKRLEEQGYPVLKGTQAVIETLEKRISIEGAIVDILSEKLLLVLEEDILRYEHQAGEQLRGEYQAWVQASQLANRTAIEYLKVNIAERKQQLEQDEAAFLLRVLNAVLDRLELTGEQRKIAAVATPEEFERVVAQGEVVK